MNSKTLLPFLAGALLLTVTRVWAQTPAPATAAARSDTGTITGRVFDQATGDPLENARVVLAGTPHVATTERGGYFTLRGIPPGDHVLVTSYSGFDSVSRPVQTQAGRESTLRIDLASGPVEMSAFVVNFRR